MPDPVTTFPSELYQGDTLKVLATFDDYPASGGWVVTYYFSGPDTDLNKAAVASGDDHLLTLTPAETSTMAVERVGWVAKAALGGEVFTAASGEVNVLADLATSGPQDNRSHAQKVLDALQATIEGKATVDQSEYTIKDRQLKRMDIDELLKWRDVYKKEVALETRTGQRNIQVQFNRP